MRFNVKEVKELATQHKCEKEGNLFFAEKQQGYFRKTTEGILFLQSFHQLTNEKFSFDVSEPILKKIVSRLK